MKVLNSQKALVLFSGGQDSATCLAWALARYPMVYTIGFQYGQRHQNEMIARQKLLTFFAAREGMPISDIVVDASALAKLTHSALTTQSADLGHKLNGLPNTFVPSRNLLFFILAASYAYSHSTAHIVGGMCETDYSGYPDCRRDAIEALQASLQLGMEAPALRLLTPLSALTKAQTWQLAEEIGGGKLVEGIRCLSYSCYNNEHTVLNEWGAGCGYCDACLLRARGWAEYRAR